MILSMTATQKFAKNTVVNHNDPMMGVEQVIVLGGPYQITTAEGSYYLVRFLEDKEEWLCYPEDLTEIN